MGFLLGILKPIGQWLFVWTLQWLFELAKKQYQWWTEYKKLKEEREEFRKKLKEEFDSVTTEIHLLKLTPTDPDFAKKLNDLKAKKDALYEKLFNP